MQKPSPPARSRRSFIVCSCAAPAFSQVPATFLHLDTIVLELPLAVVVARWRFPAVEGDQHEHQLLSVLVQLLRAFRFVGSAAWRMTADQPTEARRGRGRPRDEDIDAHIIATTLSLIDAEAEVTMSAIVERGGINRAALYRRWPSITALIAAALDSERAAFPELDLSGDIRTAVLDSVFDGGGGVEVTGYSEVRFRHRIRLVMADRQLQQEYWETYVSRRRAPIVKALRTGIERGLLRDDLDVEACFDAFMGVFYYQFVARGAQLDDPATQQRVRNALDVVWRGMVA